MSEGFSLQSKQGCQPAPILREEYSPTMACVVETGMAAHVAASMKKAPAARAHAMPAEVAMYVLYHSINACDLSTCEFS